MKRWTKRDTIELLIQLAVSIPVTIGTVLWLLPKLLGKV